MPTNTTTHRAYFDGRWTLTDAPHGCMCDGCSAPVMCGVGDCPLRKEWEIFETPDGFEAYSGGGRKGLSIEEMSARWGVEFVGELLRGVQSGEPTKELESDEPPFAPGMYRVRDAAMGSRSVA